MHHVSADTRACSDLPERANERVVGVGLIVGVAIACRRCGPLTKRASSWTLQHNTMCVCVQDQRQRANAALRASHSAQQQVRKEKKQRVRHRATRRQHGGAGVRRKVTNVELALIASDGGSSSTHDASQGHVPTRVGAQIDLIHMHACIICIAACCFLWCFAFFLFFSSAFVVALRCVGPRRTLQDVAIGAAVGVGAAVAVASIVGAIIGAASGGRRGGRGRFPRR